MCTWQRHTWERPKPPQPPPMDEPDEGELEMVAELLHVAELQHEDMVAELQHHARRCVLERGRTREG